MAYRNNVDRLCAKMGVSNVPQIAESDIGITDILFMNIGHNVFSQVAATDMNKAGRLFVQYMAQYLAGTLRVESHSELSEKFGIKEKRSLLFEMSSPLLALSEWHFGSMWDDAMWMKRELIWGIKRSEYILAVTKW